jgi:hypothetical protein
VEPNFQNWHPVPALYDAADLLRRALQDGEGPAAQKPLSKPLSKQVTRWFLSHVGSGWIICRRRQLIEMKDH